MIKRKVHWIDTRGGLWTIRCGRVTRKRGTEDPRMVTCDRCIVILVRIATEILASRPP